MLRRPALALALAAVVAGAGCVVWPGGTGPGAAPVHLAEALERVARHEAVLVDVRNPEVYAGGHIPGALNVPIEQVTDRAAELRRLGLPILYCG